VLAPALEMVPLLGGSLKAAAELASAICESIKVSSLKLARTCNVAQDYL
jgi:hypothetical protein